MPTRDKAVIGGPTWIDLGTTDIAKSLEFYKGLFGWEIEDMGEEYGHYHIATKDGRQICGMMQNGPEMEGMPSAWTIYFGTDNAAGTLDAVKAAGGSLMLEPMEVMSLGSMAIAGDDTGAYFGLWQPGDHQGFGLWGEPGSPAWFELHTRNFDEAVAFYGKVLASEVNKADFGPDMEYATIEVDGENQAGIFNATSVMQEGQPNAWLLYLLVEKTDDAVAKVTELGGQILVPPMDTPFGRMATITDSTGAILNIISPEGASM